MLIKTFFYTIILIIAILGYISYSQAPNSVKAGEKAPDFRLNDQQGKPHALSDYAGKYLILYFYPKNDTPVCTEEACHFRDDTIQLNILNANVVGISIDSSESNDEFAQKYHLPFPLLADTDGTAAKAYNSLTNLFITKIAKRRTFLINPAGNIERIYTNIDVSKHSQQIINDLRLLKQ